MADKVNISILAHQDCCGCRGCADACPKKCISFVKDQEGFLYPDVDESICISCGKCVKTCPELSTIHHNRSEKVMAAYASDVSSRNAGSSGGIFGLIAAEILAADGNVWGAAFDKDLHLHHHKATNESELRPLLRSKYLQSNTSGCYSQIIRDLKDGVPTLFAGTPCQCNALINSVGTCGDNLTTVEVVCHGVPSQDLFDKSIKWTEEKKKIKITSFTFRAKYHGAQHPQAFSYTYLADDGSTGCVNGLHYQSPFYFGFQKYITLRPSCYRCKWARPERCADITLGDFWGIENYAPELDVKNGVSLIIANTEKGKRIIDLLAGKGLIRLKDYPIEVALDNNGCLCTPTKIKPERDTLFDSLKTKSFDNVVNSHLTPHRKWIFDLYYGMPVFLRKIIRRIMDKRMKYE